MNTSQKLKEFREKWKTPRAVSYLWEKLQKELRTPSKPSWVFLIITTINVVAALLLGLERFFSVFDNRWDFFIGTQAAFFLIATLLVKKTKDNKTAMNTVAWIVTGVLLAGFTTNHSGVQSWMKDKGAEEKVATTGEHETMTTGTLKEIWKDILVPAGKCVEYTFAFHGGDFSSRPQALVDVKETDANGRELKYTDGPGMRYVLGDTISPIKIEYCSHENSSAKVIIREWKKVS